MFFGFVLLFMGVTAIIALITRSFAPMFLAAFLLYLLLNLRERHEGLK